jgi:hypothetical protein
VIDDSFGSDNGLPVDAALISAIRSKGLPVRAPDPTVPDIEQQAWLAKVGATVVLPQLASSGKEFFMVFWSREPDYSQHNARDSFVQLEPGINGSAGHAAVRNADDTLASLVDAVRKLGIEDTTDIIRYLRSWFWHYRERKHQKRHQLRRPLCQS